MNPVTHVTNAVRGKQTTNPKTVLGFYATVLGLVLAATVSTIGVLAFNKIMTELIPGLLIFAGILLVLLLVGVFVVSLLDPSKLMLTQVTGTEYAHIQQTITLGDSSRGDRVEVIPVLETVATASESASVSADSNSEVSTQEEAVVVGELEPLESGK